VIKEENEAWRYWFKDRSEENGVLRNIYEEVYWRKGLISPIYKRR
jgi:hypothetical protein